MPPTWIFSMISDLALAISLIFVKFSMCASPIFVIIPICGLINFVKLRDYQELPYVIGNKEKFKNLYINLKKIEFPFEIINRYTFFESNRWDLVTKKNQIIKLHIKKYRESLINFMEIKKQVNFE